MKVDQTTGPGYNESRFVALYHCGLKNSEPGAKKGGRPAWDACKVSLASLVRKQYAWRWLEIAAFTLDKPRPSAVYITSQALPDYGGALLAPSVRIGGPGASCPIWACQYVLRSRIELHQWVVQRSNQQKSWVIWVIATQ
eukprot:s622_g9.t1